MFQIKDVFQTTYIISNSKFISFLYPLSSLDDVLIILKDLRKKYYDATHICYGYIFENHKKFSDDGEPSGTAGLSINNVLESNKLDKVLAVCVRYFGGIKLGASGLYNAYNKSIAQTVSIAILYKEIEYKKYFIELDYSLSNKLKHYLDTNLIKYDIEYDLTVKFNIYSLDTKIEENISNLLSGININYVQNIKILSKK